MSKSEMFKAAHKLAKTFTGNYRACFALALRELRKGGLMVDVNSIVNDLNSKFNTARQLKDWEERINEVMNDWDCDKLEAIQEATRAASLKKAVYFITFKNPKKENVIKAVGNSYSIKEELKALGFTYSNNGWSKIA